MWFKNVVLFHFLIWRRYEKAVQDKEKVEDDLKRRPAPSDGPQLPSTVSSSLLRPPFIFYNFFCIVILFCGFSSIHFQCLWHEIVANCICWVQWSISVIQFLNSLPSRDIHFTTLFDMQITQVMASLCSMSIFGIVDLSWEKSQEIGKTTLYSTCMCKSYTRKQGVNKLCSHNLLQVVNKFGISS